MKLSYSMTWFEFLLVTIVLLLVYILYNALLKNYLNSVIKKLNYRNTEVYFAFFNRVFTLLILLCWVISFMLINPLIHGIIILLAGTYLYKFMSNYIHGCLMILELRLKKGMQVELPHSELASVVSVGASSLLLGNGDKLHRIAYTDLNINNGIYIKDNKAVQLSLRVSPKSEQSFDKDKALLRARLFQHPYVDDTKKIEIYRQGEEIIIVFSAVHQKYQQNIVQSIDKAGFVIQSMN